MADIREILEASSSQDSRLYTLPVSTRHQQAAGLPGRGITKRFECNSNIGWFYGGNCCGIPLLGAGLSYRIVTDSRANTTEILERI